MLWRRQAGELPGIGGGCEHLLTWDFPGHPDARSGETRDKFVLPKARVKIENQTRVRSHSRELRRRVASMQANFEIFFLSDPVIPMFKMFRDLLC